MKYLISLLFLSLLGCGKPAVSIQSSPNNISDWKELTPDQVNEAYAKDGIDGIFYASDVSYAVVSEDWFKAIFSSQEWYTFRDSICRPSYGDDCDDYARVGAAFAVFKGRQVLRGTTVAVGEFYYSPDSTTNRHALLSALVLSGTGEIRREYFEPQSTDKLGLVVSLGWWEESTCRLRKF